MNATAAQTQLRLLTSFMAQAPSQPATNFWRAIELPVLAAAMPPEGRGLDVGCGDGVLTGILRDLVGASWQLVGLDPVPAEAALAAACGLYQTVHTTGADRIAEPDATFDFAFANSVLEHIPNLPACLPEIARCLKPGGLFAATAPSPHFRECLAGPGRWRRTSRSDYLDETDRRLAHHNYWSRQRWEDELRSVGLVPEPADWYLSRRQVRRWESWANWTGGLAYRLRGRQQSPLEFQRAMGLRRGLPRPLHGVTGPLARMIGAGVLGDRTDAAEDNGCFLIRARRAAGA